MKHYEEPERPAGRCALCEEVIFEGNMFYRFDDVSVCEACIDEYIDDHTDGCTMAAFVREHEADFYLRYLWEIEKWDVNLTRDLIGALRPEFEARPERERFDLLREFCLGFVKDEYEDWFLTQFASEIVRGALG